MEKPPIRPSTAFPRDDPYPPYADDVPSRSGCGCLGWFLIVLAGCFLSCAGLCCGGYYAVFYSSWPLTRLEAAIESDGNIEVEGLTGSISGGFHIDKLRIRGESGKWSTLEQIDFEFNGVWDLLTEERLIVERFSVGRGEIYASSTGDIVAGDGAGRETIGEENADDGAGGGPPDETEIDPFKEVRIDLAEIADLTVIDEQTGIKSTLGRLAFKDFHYLDGKIKNMGVVEIEDLVARDDEMELVGFSGSTESGFRIERLAFRDAGDEWSRLEGIEFEFNGMADLLENQRMVIHRFSVAGGEIFTDRRWYRDEASPEDDEAPAGGEPAGDETELREVQFDLVQVANLKLTNRTTGVNVRVDEISISGLRFENRRVSALDDVTVRADHLEFRTGPSEYFANQPASLVSRRFSGVVRSAAHELLVADIPFHVDVCFDEGRELTRAELFDGKVVSNSDGRRQITLVCEDFTFTDYIRWQHGPLPSHLIGELTAVTDPVDAEKTVYTIGPGATFQLGELPFEVESKQIVVTKSDEVWPPLVAAHRSATGAIRCRIFALKNEPYWAIDLTADEQRPREELYADVLFGRPPGELSEEQTKTLQAALQAADRVVPED